ncbi:Hypothetical predicted protein [Paramuricea clavata]|uniref:Uncharacterized protein n=1 Tax=Paramuricea clavata TaxID=317549 RepID=A0A7D9DQY6_PARCT|nr:Hypothetical predicted protein [Paramuricea clavata]
MSSIITSILSSTVGLLWNKARDATAKKLKDGDITDAKLREIVVRELNDVKTKIDGLSRKDLLSSYSFLQEGVQLLIVSLDKSKDEQKAVQSKIQDDRGQTSRMPRGDESLADILNKALELSHVMGKLKIVSKDSESAKERLKDAQKLHDLSAVREIFSVYLGGGVKSIFSKAERVENVKSVMMINYVLYQFVFKFSSKYCSALVWPTIQLSDRSFNPIWNWQEVSARKSWGKELIQPHSEMKVVSNIDPYNTAINSRGEIVEGHHDDIDIISRIGERKVVYEFSVPSTKDKKGEVIKE